LDGSRAAAIARRFPVLTITDLTRARWGATRLARRLDSAALSKLMESVGKESINSFERHGCVLLTSCGRHLWYLSCELSEEGSLG
jgi:hypothetical protein